MSDWYNIDKLNKYAPDAMINFIIGERRIGKTFFFQKMAIENYENNGKQTLWLRNKKTEFDPPFSSDFMNGLNSINIGTKEYIPKPHGLFELTDDDEEKLAIKFQSVSTFSNVRGNAYPDINLIVFDEFCPEDRRYPKNCHTGLLSLTKTILSGKEDAKVYCLSNYVSVANPYFVGFNIYPNEKYDVTNFRDKNVAIEVCRNYRCAIEEDNKWNAVYNAGQYSNYASAKEDELSTLICQAPKNSRRYYCYIRSEGITYGCDIDNSVMYWHKCEPTNNGLVFGKTLQDCNDKIGILPRGMKRQLKEWQEQNIMRYTDANTMFVILSIIYSDV